MFLLNAEQFAQYPAEHLRTLHDHDLHTPFLLSSFTGGQSRQYQYSGNHDQDQLYWKQRGDQKPCSKSGNAASGIVSVTTFHKISSPPFRLIAVWYCSYHSQHILKQRQWCQSFEQKTKRRPVLKDISAGRPGKKALLTPRGLSEVNMPFSNVYAACRMDTPVTAAS